MGCCCSVHTCGGHSMFKDECCSCCLVYTPKEIDARFAGYRPLTIYTEDRKDLVGKLERIVALRNAAEAGDAVAAYEMGIMHHVGVNELMSGRTMVPRKLPEAVRMYTIAANKGCLKSAALLTAIEDRQKAEAAELAERREWDAKQEKLVKELKADAV